MATIELVKPAHTTRSTIALKLVMASSGILFILYVLMHMYGNLRAFWGQAEYDGYAEHLRTMLQPILGYGGLLWIIRAILIVAVLAHIYSAATLWKRANHARPVKYQVKRNVGSSLSSRTMRWGGLTLLLFLIWHLLEFTIVKINVGDGGSIKHDPFALLVHTFHDAWWMTVIYLLAMVALAFHLHHGTFSALQTLGCTNSAASRMRARAFGWAVAIVIAGGFALVPLFVLFGVIK